MVLVVGSGARPLDVIAWWSGTTVHPERRGSAITGLSGTDRAGVRSDGTVRTIARRWDRQAVVTRHPSALSPAAGIDRQ
jgi:hypothetical protein